MAGLPPGFVLDTPNHAPMAVPLPVGPQRARDNAREDRKEGRDANKDARDAVNDAERLRIDRERLIASLYEKGLRPGPNGPEPIPGWQPPIDPTKPTEYQAKSAGFLGRMLQSDQDYQAVPPGSRDPRTVAGQFLHDWTPGLENSLPTWLGGNSPERQLADQASRNFISSSLRQESGSAINPVEFDRQYQIFYPQPGDDNSVIEQKRRARTQAVDGFRTAAGPLAPRIEAAQRGRSAPSSFSPEAVADANQSLATGFQILTREMQGKTPAQRQAMLARYNADPRIAGIKSRAGFRDPGGRASTAGAPRKSGNVIRYDAQGNRI